MLNPDEWSKQQIKGALRDRKNLLDSHHRVQNNSQNHVLHLSKFISLFFIVDFITKSTTDRFENQRLGHPLASNLMYNFTLTGNLYYHYNSMTSSM